MASAYPAALPSAPATHGDVEDDIQALAAELGVQPSGPSSTVAARLSALDTALAGKVGDADPRMTNARAPLAHTQSLDTTTDTTTRVAMLPAERTKLTAVAAGATANATNAELRDRTTHTGVAPQSSVSGLIDALDARATTSALTVEREARIAADGLLIPASQKAAQGGVATLDANGVLSAGQRPASAVAAIRYLNLINVSGAVTLDLQGTVSVANLTLSGTVTSLTIVNPPQSGNGATIRIVQTSGGASFTYPPEWRWDQGVSVPIAPAGGEDTIVELLWIEGLIFAGISGSRHSVAAAVAYYYNFTGMPDGPVPAAEFTAQPGTGLGSAVGIVSEKLRMTVGTSGSGDGARVIWKGEPTKRRGWEARGRLSIGLASNTWTCDLSYTGGADPTNSYYELRVISNKWTINKRTTAFSQIGADNLKTFVAGTEYEFFFSVDEAGRIEASVWNVGAAQPVPNTVVVPADASRASIPAGVVSFNTFGSGTSGGYGTLDEVTFVPGTQ